jgi:hypothetical protein
MKRKLPFLEIPQGLYEKIKVNRIRAVKIILVRMSFDVLLG